MAENAQSEYIYSYYRSTGYFYGFILRDELTTRKAFVFDEITQKLQSLTPKQRKTASDIMDAYLKNLDCEMTGDAKLRLLF